MLLEVTLAGAFLGGTLALLSPCSALLLPAFFAYAFKSRRELAGRTLIFLLGLSTLLVPLGLGAGFAGSLILEYRTQTLWAVSAVLILLGTLELMGKGFLLAPQRFAQRTMDGSRSSAYITGLVYGFAGFCSGPLLGAVLTMAAGVAHPLQGALLLFAYASGMALPLFLLALLWDRFDLGSRAWLRGREIQLGPFRVHTTNLVTGGLFILLGVLFFLSGGSVAFEGLYSSLGLVELSMALQARIVEWTARIPDGITLLGMAALMGWAAWRRCTRRGPRGGGVHRR